MTHEEAVKIANGGQGAIVATLRQLAGHAAILQELCDSRERAISSLLDRSEAAPDLLEALRAVVDWRGLDGDGISDPLRLQVLAAISKAEGR